MLKKETFHLLDSKELNFKNVFSICIGKTFLYQDRFIDYIGKYNGWDTNVEEGVLKLDDRSFDVEYIGTTSKADNLWYSSELERVIPDKYVDLMIRTRKLMQDLNLEELTKGKIALSDTVNGYNLSMIYIAFAPEDVAYFCGSGDVSIYMFVKNLPKDIFRKISSVEFSARVMEIISTFDFDHRLMVKALLIENEIDYRENKDNIVAVFDEESQLTVGFDNNVIKSISSNLH